jgi:hypothetical protein
VTTEGLVLFLSEGIKNGDSVTIHTGETKKEYGTTWEHTYTLCIVWSDERNEWAKEWIKTHSFCCN